MDRKQLRYSLILVLTSLIWGCAFVAQSVGAEYVGAYTFLASRSWLGFFAVLPVVFAIDRINLKNGRPSAKPKTASEKKTLLIGGLACGSFLFAASAAQQIGIETTTTAKAGFITALYVLIVPLISIFLGKRVGKKIWLCVLIGLVGLYLLCMKDSLRLSPGDTMVLLCALLFSGQIMSVDHFAPKTDSVRLSAMQFLVEAVLATVFMLIFEKPDIASLRAAALPILYAGIMSSGVAYTLQIVAQKGLDPTLASLIMCLESVFSALSGWLLLGQGLSLRELIGCVLMFAAIVLAQLPERHKACQKAR